jgi:predicted DNA-binding protein
MKTTRRRIKDGQRIPLSLRVTPETKARLDAITASSGRSISYEVESRLDATLDDENYVVTQHISRRLVGHYNLNKERVVAQLLLDLEEPITGERPDRAETARRRQSMVDVLIAYVDPDAARDAEFFEWLAKKAKVVGKLHREHHAKAAP